MDDRTTDVQLDGDCSLRWQTLTYDKPPREDQSFKSTDELSLE